MARQLSKRTKQRVANIERVISRYSDLSTGLISVRVDGNEKLEKLERDLRAARFLVASSDPEIREKDAPHDILELARSLGEKKSQGSDFSDMGLALLDIGEVTTQRNLDVLDNRIVELYLFTRQFDKSLEGIELQMDARQEEAKSWKEDVKAGKRGTVAGIKESIKRFIGMIGLSAATGALIGFAKGAAVTGYLVAGALGGVVLCLGIVAYAAVVRSKREAKYLNDRLESFSKRISNLYFSAAVKAEEYGKDVSTLIHSLLYSAPEPVRKEAEKRLKPWHEREMS